MAVDSRSNLHMFLPLFVASLLFNLSAADVDRKLPQAGGWQPVDPKEPKVQEIGKFAVTEHNKEAKTNLKYEEVVKGDVQVVAGFNYRLIIAATDGSNPGKYQAIVWDKPWQHFRNLTSFVPVTSV